MDYSFIRSLIFINRLLNLLRVLDMVYKECLNSEICSDRPKYVPLSVSNEQL